MFSSKQVQGFLCQCFETDSGFAHLLSSGFVVVAVSCAVKQGAKPTVHLH